MRGTITDVDGNLNCLARFTTPADGGFNRSLGRLKVREDFRPVANARLLTRPTDLGLRQTLSLSRPKALLQRLLPVTVVRPTAGRRHQADIQPSGRRRDERQQSVEQRTCGATTRDLGPRTTVPPGPGGLKSTRCRHSASRQSGRSTFEMGGGRRRAKYAGNRPLDGGVMPHRYFDSRHG